MMANPSNQSAGGAAARPGAGGWTISALAVSLAGAGGSLWLSMGMDLKACPLCLYQRTFMMAVCGVLLMGLVVRLRSSPIVAVLALPAAAGGLGVAAFHAYLEISEVLECPPGVLGLGTAPQQSLALFIALIALLLAGAAQGEREGRRLAAMAIACILGFVMAAGAILSAPPLPAPPTAPYEKPLDMCRPPFSADQ